MYEHEILEVYKRINNALKYFDDKINITPDGEEKNNLIKFKCYVSETVSDILDYAMSVFIRLKDDNYNTQKGYVIEHSQKDNRRRIYHNALISSLKLADNICNKFGIEPIYGNFGEFEKDTAPLFESTLSSEASLKRIEISKWALYVVNYSLTKETNLTTGYIKKDAKASDELNELYNCITISDLGNMFNEKVRGM